MGPVSPKLVVQGQGCVHTLDGVEVPVLPQQRFFERGVDLVLAGPLHAVPPSRLPDWSCTADPAGRSTASQTARPVPFLWPGRECAGPGMFRNRSRCTLKGLQHRHAEREGVQGGVPIPDFIADVKARDGHRGCVADVHTQPFHGQPACRALRQAAAARAGSLGCPDNKVSTKVAAPASRSSAGLPSAQVAGSSLNAWFRISMRSSGWRPGAELLHVHGTCNQAYQTRQNQLRFSPPGHVQHMEGAVAEVHRIAGIDVAMIQKCEGQHVHRAETVGAAISPSGW